MNLRRDLRWRGENNPGLKLSVNARRVSQGCISRRIFVAHRTGKFPGIKETRDARQMFWLVQLAAGAASGWRCSTVVLHSAPHKALWSGCPVEPEIRDLRGLNLRLNGTWTVSQARRFQRNSIWASAVGQTKWRFQTLRVESFTVGTAEPRMVQLGGGRASTITKAICPY